MTGMKDDMIRGGELKMFPSKIIEVNEKVSNFISERSTIISLTNSTFVKKQYVKNIGLQEELNKYISNSLIFNGIMVNELLKLQGYSQINSKEIVNIPSTIKGRTVYALRDYIA